MTRHARTARLIASALLLSAGAAHAQTGIPRGGKEITPGAGSRQLQIQVRNDTGLDVEDITIAAYNASNTDIVKVLAVDVVELSSDQVDDNGDGKLALDEFDTRKDRGNNGVVKSIFASEHVANNATVTVNIEFESRTTQDTRLMVKFSNESGGRHWDLLASAPIEDGAYECFVPVTPGAPQLGSRLDNNSTDPIIEFALPLNPENPIIDFCLPDDYWNSLVIPQEDVIIIQLDPPLDPNQQLGFYFELESPICSLPEAFRQPVFVLPPPPPCRADVNEDGVVDTRDYLEFLNLYNTRDPYADWNHDGLINTLDFIAFQNDWTNCR